MSAWLWSDFSVDNDNPNVQCSWKHVEQWVHIRVSPIGEKNPNRNNIHIKYPYQGDNTSYKEEDGILCSVRTDDYSKEERRNFIEEINKITKMDIPYNAVQINPKVDSLLMIKNYEIDAHKWGASPHYLLRNQKEIYFKKILNYTEDEYSGRLALISHKHHLYYEGLLTTHDIILRDYTDLLRSNNKYLYSSPFDSFEFISVKGGNPSISLTDIIDNSSYLIFSSEKLYALNNIIARLAEIASVYLKTTSYSDRCTIAKINIPYKSASATLASEKINLLSFVCNLNPTNYISQTSLLNTYNPHNIATAVDGARKFIGFHELSHFIRKHNDPSYGRYRTGILFFDPVAYNDTEIRELQADKLAINLLLEQFNGIKSEFHVDILIWELIGVCLYFVDEYINCAKRFIIYADKVGFNLLRDFRELEHFVWNIPTGQILGPHPAPGVRLNWVLIEILFRLLDDEWKDAENYAKLRKMLSKLWRITNSVLWSLAIGSNTKPYLRRIQENSNVLDVSYNIDENFIFIGKLQSALTGVILMEDIGIRMWQSDSRQLLSKLYEKLK